METYTVSAGDGIGITANVSGLMEIGLSGVIAKDVTFGGNVTFNGTTTTINATEVTIDDYNIVLGAVNSNLGESDENIGASGGGGVILKRSNGPDASVLWNGITTGLASPTLTDFGIGCSGEWVFTDYISLTGGVGIKSKDDTFRFRTGTNATGSGFMITVANGPGGIQTFQTDSMRLGHHSTAGTGGAGLTYGIHLDEDGMVRIYDGVNKKVFTHTSHGFTFGQCVRLRDGGTCDFAIANSKEEAEVFGVVSEVLDANTYVVTMNGEIRGDFSSTLGVAGPLGATLESGAVYFLSDATNSEGEISATEITTAGKIRKPVVIGMGETAGLVIQYVGAKISPELDTVAPVMRRLNLNADATVESGSTIFSNSDITETLDGQYHIVHSFGTDNYSVSVTPRHATQSYNGVVESRSTNGITIGIWNQSNTRTSAEVEIIFAKDV